MLGFIGPVSVIALAVVSSLGESNCRRLQPDIEASPTSWICWRCKPLVTTATDRSVADPAVGNELGVVRAGHPGRCARYCRQIVTQSSTAIAPRSGPSAALHSPGHHLQPQARVGWGLNQLSRCRSTPTQRDASSTPTVGTASAKASKCSSMLTSTGFPVEVLVVTGGLLGRSIDAESTTSTARPGADSRRSPLHVIIDRPRS